MKKVIKLLRIFLRKLGLSSIYFRGNYSSYQEALTNLKTSGYVEENLIKCIFLKTNNYIDVLKDKKDYELNVNEIALLNAIMFSSMDGINVFDIGGGFGLHYFLVKTLNVCKINFWNVIETKPIVDHIKRNEDQKLLFHYDLDDLILKYNKIDLTIFMSSLQYLPAPYEYLEKIIFSKSKLIFIGRIPLLNDHIETISLQHSYLNANGPGPLPNGFKNRRVVYPVHLLSKHKLVEYIKTEYDLVYLMKSDKFYYNKNKEFSIYNLLFKRK